MPSGASLLKDDPAPGPCEQSRGEPELPVGLGEGEEMGSWVGVSEGGWEGSVGREGEGRAEAAEHLPEGVRWTPHQAGGLLQLQGPLAWPHPASWLPRPGRLCSLVNGARRSYFKSWQQFPVPGYDGLEIADQNCQIRHRAWGGQLIKWKDQASGVSFP